MSHCTPDVIAVQALEGHTVRLTFANGKVHDVDLAPYIDSGPVFERVYNDPEFFRAVYIVGGTIKWPNNADIAPETLYFNLGPDPTEEAWLAAKKAYEDSLPNDPPIFVTAVRVVKLYVLHVTFNDGSEQTVDLEPVLYGPGYEELRDPALFRQVAIDPESGNLIWPGAHEIGGVEFDEYEIEADRLWDWPNAREEWIKWSYQWK
jgi:hypothetical protein